MRVLVAPRALSLSLAVTFLAIAAGAIAQNAHTDAAAETEMEKQERQGRRQCAAQLCSTLHNLKPAEGQVTCNIQKTWRKEALTKILSRGKVSWPWGDTRCASEVRFDRAILVKAMQELEFETQFEAYDIRCEIDSAKDKYNIEVQVKPTVTFKQGKAVKASLNWGKIEGPPLAKSALWSMTAADNTFGLLQSITVDDINEFVNTKCLEIKDEWHIK